MPRDRGSGEPGDVGVRDVRRPFDAIGELPESRAKDDRDSRTASAKLIADDRSGAGDIECGGHRAPRRSRSMLSAARWMRRIRSFHEMKAEAKPLRAMVD